MTTPRSPEPQRPEVIEGEVIPLAEVLPRPLQYPPAVRSTCACGKGNLAAHGGFTCAEVLAIRARYEFSLLPPWQRLRARLRGQAPEGWPR